MRLDRTLCRRPSLSSDKRTTTEAEQELLTSWTCRRSECAVDQEVDLGRTSTPELACDAVTSGTLQRRRSGQLMRAGTPALLMDMVCGRVAARAADSETFVPLLLSHVLVFGSEVDVWMTLDERHPTMWLRHAADGRPCPEVDKTAGPGT